MLNRYAAVALIGRLLMAVLFLASSFGKVTQFQATVVYMEAHGIPFAPLLCAGAVALEAVGGMALLLGFYARTAAALLTFFVAAATVIFHLAADQRVDLLKNLAVMGGLLQVVTWGPGDISLEGRRG